MSRKSSKLSDQQWDDHKALIREWYLVQDKSLKEVQSKLKEQGLDATTHQIETKIKKWKFRKNIDKKTWISIDHHITKRKRDKKEYEVILCGKRMKPETVTKETGRYGDRSILTQLALLRKSSPPPLTDCQVAVCTPQPIKMEFEWPTTLPWLKFSSRELPMVLKACKPFTLGSQNVSSSDLVSAILPKALRTDMAYIGVSKLAAIIGRSMPETYPQENLQRAQSLLSGSAEDLVRENVSIIIYNMSNNALDLEEDYKWEQTMKVLEDCGIFRLDVDLKKDKSPTIDGFMEKLFDVSIRRCLPTKYHDRRDARAETAVKWLVTSGYCPNTAAETLWTRLQDFYADRFGTKQHVFDLPKHISVEHFGTQQQVLDLTKYLLNAGASANILVPRSGYSQTILEIALQHPWSSDTVFNLAEHLFKHGASKNLDRALHFAIMRKEKDLVEMIVQHKGDLTASLEPLSNSPLHKETALSVAAFTSLQQTQHILKFLSFLYPLTPLTTFITPDVLIAAAAKGHNHIIHFLYSISPTIMANEYGITPLHTAVRWGHLSTCQLLLPLQVARNTWATAKFSPLHAACYGGHKDVVEFLIMNGADVDAAPRFDSDAEEHQFNCRLDMLYYTSGIAPLDFLLNENKLRLLSPIDARLFNLLCCAAMLIRAGAKLVGSELSIAAEYCHLELLAAGIAAGANPNGVDGQGKTPLQRALQGASNKSNRLYGVVSQLLSKGAQLLGGEVDSAVGLKQWEVATLLIEHGGNKTKTGLRKELEEAILVRDNEWAARVLEIEPSIYSAGALYAAIAMGNNSLIQSLKLNRPAETSEDPFEITAIAVAATSGNLVLLQDLLAHPPSCHTGPLPLEKIDSVTDYGICKDDFYDRFDFYGGEVMYSVVEDIRSGEYQPGNRLDLRIITDERLCGSPLALVASSMRSDALEACSQLLESGFCADELTWVAAASFNNIAFVQTLLNHGQRGDYSYRGFDGWSPLVCAIGHRNKELITLLLTAGVDANGREPYVGEPLLAAVAKGDLDIVEHLVIAGADANSREPYVGEPLLAAVAKGDLDIVNYLIRAGANVNASNRSFLDRSPLQKAVEEGKTDIVHCLVQAGADVNSPPAEEEGATPLQFAAINGHLGLAKYLIDKGAQVNAPPSRFNGRTALQGAAEHGRLDMLAFLLTEGALTTGRWRRRFIKAVILAIEERHFIAADLLKQSAGWSEEDENSLLLVDIYHDTDSEGDELDNAATDRT
ncbi:ankyrin repeat-containing domain protein [Xylariaceae sp. AK1471]|nr:ankyrin repeat-containing domain protein [Xylariaceae sp. AK1471]